VHDLDDVWRDDQLIEALASGDPVDTDDPAAAPLRALTGLVDAAPIPDYDVRDLPNLGDAVMLDTGRNNHRLAVRSLAVALTAVATLSTSGVAAVVTGDPFQPAKVVWHQIQERAGDRWGADPADAESRLDSGSAIGGDTGQAEAGTEGDSETSAQSAALEAARHADEPAQLKRVALPGQRVEQKDGLETGQTSSQDRAVAKADATTAPQGDQRARAQGETTDDRQDDERTSGTSATEDSAQQREDDQRSEEEQEAQDSRRSDQPEEDEQESTSEAPTDDLDSGVVPDSTEEGPTDDYDSMRSAGEDSDDTEDSEGDSEGDSEEDSETSDGATSPDSASYGEDPSTEEPTAEEPADDGSWAGLQIEQRAGSTDETVAPPRLKR
jgi:hypothetical protein